MGTKDCDLLLKVAVIGPSGSGKSSLLRAIQRGPPYGSAQHSGETRPADDGKKKPQELDFCFKLFKCKQSDQELLVNTTFWDIGGAAIDSALLPSYLANCHAVLLLADCTSADPTRELRPWLDKMKALGLLHLPVLLVAAKSDLNNSVPKVDWKDLLAGDEMMMPGEALDLVSTSSITGEGLELVLQRIVEKVLGRKKEDPKQDSASVSKDDNALDIIQQSKREFQQKLQDEKRRALDRLFQQGLHLLMAVAVVGLAYVYYTKFFSSSVVAAAAATAATTTE